MDSTKRTSTVRRVAVAVPLPTRTELNRDEKVSLRHLETHLGDHDIYFVAPEGLALPRSRHPVKRFPARYFGSVAAHNRLLLDRRFYAAFAEYDFVLVYHLDALVFSGDLVHWCNLGLDYIAAPWLRRNGDSRPIGFTRCGNGGFSLRRISSFMQVIDPPEQHVGADQAWSMLLGGRPQSNRYLLRPVKYLLRSGRVNRSWWVRRLFRRNEDCFWAEYAQMFYPQFKVVSPELALGFAFDDGPRFCYEQNAMRLPFGCHGWNKYDREFWVPFLMPS